MVNGSYHSGIGAPENYRPFREFSLLKSLHEESFPCPKPVFAAARRICGGLCYQGFIGTERMAGYLNFLEWLSSSNNTDSRSVYSKRAGELCDQLLSLGVFHTDLHPGNVLVDIDSQDVVVIDFDKYREVEQDEIDIVRSKQEARWSRSLRKHFDVSGEIVRDTESSFQKGLRS